MPLLKGARKRKLTQNVNAFLARPKRVWKRKIIRGALSPKDIDARLAEVRRSDALNTQKVPEKKKWWPW